MTIIGVSFDMDNCMLNKAYVKGKSKNVILHNKNLLDKIIEKYKKNKIIVFLGSNRQSFSDDRNNAYRIHSVTHYTVSKSCFPALETIAEYLNRPHKNVMLDRMLMSDIYNGLKDGTSFLKARKANIDTIAAHDIFEVFSQKSDGHAEWFFDHTKVSLVYAQAHKLAGKFPSNEELVYVFFDDRKDILIDGVYNNLEKEPGLAEFFTRYSHALPRNLTLKLKHYAGQDVTTIASIRGSGEINHHFRETIRSLGGHIKKNGLLSCEGYYMTRHLPLLLPAPSINTTITAIRNTFEEEKSSINQVNSIIDGVEEPLNITKDEHVSELPSSSGSGLFFPGMSRLAQPHFTLSLQKKKSDPGSSDRANVTQRLNLLSELITTEWQHDPDKLLLIKKLEVIYEKYNNLKDRRYSEAADATLHLFDTLTSLYQQFLKMEINAERFHHESMHAIATARETLANPRGWLEGWHRQFEIIIHLISIITLIPAAVMLTVNYCQTGQFMLFKFTTDSNKKLNELEGELNKIHAP